VTEKEAIACELPVLRCRQGQRDALEEMVRTWERPLFYYIHRLVDDEDEALHVMQQTWFQALQGLRRLREPRKLPAWLYSIARKTALSYLRTRYSERALFRNGEAVSQVDDGDVYLSFGDAERIHYGLGRLSLMHREILTLFFLLVFGGLYMILRVVYRMERKTQEKLLEMEYRLADLAERLGDRKPE
jgi:RNA polymerase sigma-70 factor (ECF subfamily)